MSNYKINKQLKTYIEENIFPQYKYNDRGHNLDHIKYVIDRSIKFADTISDINYEMVYTIASFHDIGHYIDAKNHEKVSSDIFLNDEKMKDFFSNEERKIISEAIADHRASLQSEPRTIYGKIISSADRNTKVDAIIERTYAYRIVHNPNDSIDEIIEEARQHIINKFGEKGYAKEKIYFEDKDYTNYLEELSNLISNKEKFVKRYCKVNNIKLD